MITTKQMVQVTSTGSCCLLEDLDLEALEEVKRLKLRLAAEALLMLSL
jgi:hypothetical protein